MTVLNSLWRNVFVRRLLEAVLTLVGVSVLTFAVLRVLPGDQITASYGIEAGALSPDQLASLRAYYGIDRPLVAQYFSWLGGVLSGNLGVATQSHQDVLDMTLRALPITLELAVLSIVVALVLGVPGGLLAASRAGALRDNGSQLLSLLALSVPTFLVATAISSWLANRFGYNPNGEEFATLLQDPGLNLQQMALPALVLGVSIAAPVFQTTPGRIGSAALMPSGS